VPPLPRGRRRSSRSSAVLNRRLPLPSGQSLHPATSIHQRGPHYGASTEVYAIHPSGLPLACDSRIERASLGFALSFEPRRPRAGRRTSGWGQAMSTGLELRTRHQSNLLSTCSLVSVRPRVATALEDKIVQRALVEVLNAIYELGRAGARCRRCRRSVSPTRPPNRTCPFLSIRLSTGHAMADRDVGLGNGGSRSSGGSACSGGRPGRGDPVAAIAISGHWDLGWPREPCAFTAGPVVPPASSPELFPGQSRVLLA
jgi:hypothetical protein